MSVEINVDFRLSLGGVKDQGERPLCLSYATSTAHEFHRGNTTPLSTEYLHHYAANGDPLAPATLAGMAQALFEEGQPTEALCAPRTAPFSTSWAPPVSVPVYKRQSIEAACSSDALEGYLRAGNAPVLGITVPTPFFKPQFPWIISPSGVIRGRHAVVAVGLGMYQGRKHFLIRNSWGDGWGDVGHAWLEEAFLSTHLFKIFLLTTEVDN